MFDAMDIRDDIETSAAHATETMPAEIKKLVALAQQDLHAGPVYLDGEGDIVSCFDEGATRFDFPGACRKASDWADTAISGVSVEVAYDEETDTAEYEYVDGSREQVLRMVFGKELAAHL